MTESGATLAAHAFVQRLIDLGLHHAVLSPGSRNAPVSILLAQAAESGLLNLHVRVDEREAAFLAVGLSKNSDMPTLLCCTSGTAAVNFAPAVVEAFYSQVPMIVLTADRPPGAAARGASQSIEQAHLFHPHTVVNLDWCAQNAADAAADRARIAWNAARGQRRGPAHVNMHFSEPLLATIADWPAVRPREPFPVSQPTVVSPSIPKLPDLGVRPVVVVGDVPHHEHAALASLSAFAVEHSIPVLMEPTAGCRRSEVSIRHHALVADNFLSDATSVVSVGRFGLGRHLRRLCESVPMHIAAAPHGGGANPFTTADLVLPITQLSSALQQWSQTSAVEPTWLAAWQRADNTAHLRLLTTLDEWTHAPSGLHVAAEVLAVAQTRNAQVFAAASRSIRDVDLVTNFNAPAVTANLGVNGIDGLISTATGLALDTGQHTYLLLGDIAFIHGSNGLLRECDQPKPPLTIVVIDDNGGAIFSDLEQGAADYAPWFERVFGTPHGLNLATVAQAYGVRSVTVGSLTELREALNQDVADVIVVKAASRELSHQLRAALRG